MARTSAPLFCDQLIIVNALTSEVDQPHSISGKKNLVARQRVVAATQKKIEHGDTTPWQT
jgi:hypothetical protein